MSKNVRKEFTGREEGSKKPNSHKAYKAKHYSKKDKAFQSNDFAWWNKYPTLTQNSGEFPFNYINGTPLSLEGYFASLPTVVVLDYYPTIGRSISPESSFNSQIRSLWLDMHRKYRGIGTYEAADLGAFTFCSVDFFAEIARAEKVYGYVRNVQATNRSIPYTLLAAMGVDYDSLSKNLANYRAALNIINQKASSICLPKGFSALSDAVVLASATIADSTSQRASYYTFNKEIFYTFSGTQYSTGSACIAHTRTFSPGAQYQQWDDIITDLQTQLSVLLDDSDCQRMASDILAAYSENGVETRQALTEDYLAPMGKDDVRLLQIHNATICGYTNSANTVIRPTNITPGGITGTMAAPYMDIIQYNNAMIESLSIANITAAPALTVTSTTMAANPELNIPFLGTNGYEMLRLYQTQADNIAVRNNDRLLDTWADTPSLEDKMEMTRFTVPISTYRGIDDSSADTWYSLVHGSGTNIIVACRVYSKDLGGGLQAAYVQEVPQVVPAWTTGVGRLSQFDWHPIIYVANQAWDNASGRAQIVYSATEVVGDIDHVTVASDRNDILPRLHDAALMSAYKCELSATSKFELT